MVNDFSLVVQVRRENLIRDTQRKLEKQRRLLHDEEEAVGGVNYPEFTGDLLQQIESDKQRFQVNLHLGDDVMITSLIDCNLFVLQL